VGSSFGANLEQLHVSFGASSAKTQGPKNDRSACVEYSQGGEAAPMREAGKPSFHLQELQDG
jgi:hypothetical protein